MSFNYLFYFGKKLIYSEKKIVRPGIHVLVYMSGKLERACECPLVQTKLHNDLEEKSFAYATGEF